MLVDELLAPGEVGMLHGQPRDGKTWAALDLAIAVATAGTAYGLDRLRAPRARPVLIVGNEDSRAAYAERFRLLLAGRGLATPPDTLRLLVGRGASLDEADWRERLLDEVRRDGVGLVIIVPLRSVTGAADQGPAELRPVSAFLRRMVGETGCAVLVVHHDVKPRPDAADARRRAQRASGGGLFSTVDAPVHVERLDQTRSLLTPDGTKHRPDPAPLVVERQSGDGWVRLIAETTSAGTADDLALDHAIVDHLRQSGGGSQRAIVRAVGKHHQLVKLALDRLLATGVVDTAEGPRRAQLWFLR
jgi:RecA-family ATPase